MEVRKFCPKCFGVRGNIGIFCASFFEENRSNRIFDIRYNDIRGD